jgi:hypothetical protein
MEDWTYDVKIGTLKTHDFKVGNGVKQGDGLEPNFYTKAME